MPIPRRVPRRRRPVLIVRSPPSRVVDMLLGLAGGRAVVVGPRLQVRLAAAGPARVLVDLAGGARCRERWARTGHHLAPGGWHLLRVPRGSGRRARWLLARHRDAALLTLREEEYDEVAAGRGLPDVVLEVRAGRRYPAIGRVTTDRPLPLNPLTSYVEAPPAWLREHREVLCLPRQVAFQDGLVLPATFRSPTARRLRTTALTGLSDRFVAAPGTGRDPVARLRGAYLHLDSEIPGHFGHAVTETLSRLWGWPDARRHHPDVRVLVPADPEEWFLDLLAAAGVPRERVTPVRGPVRVERLLTASALYSIGRYAHPDLREVLARTGGALEARADAAPSPRRVFLTRDSHRRRCRNRAEVEALFAAHGYAVVRPETLPLPQQVALVRRAAAVAGFAGSVLLHLALRERPAHVTVLTSDTYHVHNEVQLSALLGHELHVVVSRADVPRPGRRFHGPSYRSAFAVDLDDEGRFLREVLADAPG